MVLAASCPRCPSAPTSGSRRADGPGEAAAATELVTCPEHGRVTPLWRPEECDYASFSELVARAEDLPTYLPWPLSPGWRISDVGCVGTGRGSSATVTSVSGTSDLDGAVEVTVVAEEPGVGLGGRCAGIEVIDPGDLIAAGPYAVRVHAGGQRVPLWALEAAPDDEPLSRSVFAGEAEGRWLWLVMRPASAMLLLRDDWLLADVSGFGPEALEIPFGGPRARW